MKNILNKIPKFSDWLLESTSGEIFKPKRGKKVEFNHRKYPELANELFTLINTAYAEIGGHSKVTNPNDVFNDPDWDYWAGTDIHDSSDFDIIVFGKKTKFGIKYSGVGHDGSKEAKREYLEQRGKELKQLGYYVEVSGKIAEILMNKYKVPTVDSQKDVEKILGKPVEWLGKNPSDSSSSGDSWYRRTLGGKPHNKIMLGKPKI
jgi:hypothetical protein